MALVYLTEAGTHVLPTDNAGWLSAEESHRITGWDLKPEGMCRGDVCVPLPAALRRDERVDIAAFWRHVGAPVVSDDSGAVVALGVPAEERRAALQRLNAPDFSLPDLEGVTHRLADFRGRKVLLVTWASW